MAKKDNDERTGAPESSARGPRLQRDRLVEQLVPDPANPEATLLLVGFIGEGTQPGMWRLYLGPELNEYVEFSEQDVVNSEPLPAEQSPMGGTMVWVRASSTLQLTRITSQQIQASFLQGPITSAYMPGATATLHARTGTRPETGVACTRNYVCSINPHIPACQVHTEFCGSAFCGPNTGPFCPTGAFIQGC